MFRILKYLLKAGRLTSEAPALNLSDVKDWSIELARINRIPPITRQALSRSLLIRHLDVGSCNAEEAELIALTSPYYDLSRFGIDFTASPRHADILTVSGPVTRHLAVAMQRTYQAMPKPNIVVAIGDGACNGSPYEKSYACLGRVDQFLPVDFYIPGDPPSPQKILEGLLLCQQILARKECDTVGND